ncbi:MAG: YncE family protein [Bacteroidales bacterium]
MNSLKNRFWVLFSVLLLLLNLSSCKKDPTVIVDPPLTDNKGVFICNEGPFMSGTGTLSFYDRENGKLSNSIYELINNKPLGNIVQSMEIANNKGFIVVNNANKVEVINMTTLKWEATVDQLTLPRYMCKLDDNRAYISCWDNTVAVLNLNTLVIEKNIPVQTGPERMVKHLDMVFVLNQGGFGTDSTISVINSTNDQVIRTLQVHPKPTGGVVDKEGMLWILCSGMGFNGFPSAGDTPGHLLQIDPQTFIVLNDFVFPDNINHPEKLVINKNGDRLFYLYKNGVYGFGIADNSLSQQPFILHQGYLYALGLDPETDYIYTSDPVDFVQNGWVFRYNSSTGLAVDSFQTGIIPTFFCFH